MPSSYPVSFSARLLLIVFGLVVLIGVALYLLPASSLRYIGIYYAVVGIFNLIILPLFHLLRHSRIELPQLEVAKLAGVGRPASWSAERG